MKFYSTNSPDQFVDLKEAVLNSLPADNGLYMPRTIPSLDQGFIDILEKLSFQEIAFEIAKAFLDEDLTKDEIRKIISESIDFPAPVVSLDQNLSVLELYHGPSLAFKDFGARFMSRLMSWLNSDSSKMLNILVATSGDTGGAVASGFLGVPGIRVVILYPSGRVSALQEKQLTTLGGNITAIEVNGSFDDCQALVKKAFLDVELSKNLRLSSANSINISRLIPQIFYYFEAYKQVCKKSQNIVFSIPSGNFGNLTAALIGKKMGLPVKGIIAATNVNKVVPEYLYSGVYKTRKSIATLSNAMDVGAPSNFARILDLCNHSHPAVCDQITGSFYNDNETVGAIKSVYHKYNYLLDPHGAVGYLASCDYQRKYPEDHCIVVETAHPIKFDRIYSELKIPLTPPKSISGLMDKEKTAIEINFDYDEFKSFLLLN